MVLFYLSGAGAASVIRANTNLFLALLDVGILLNLLVHDLVGLRTLALSALLALLYFAMLLIGQRLFVPSRERFRRGAAYAIIGIAILGGLPLFD